MLLIYQEIKQIPGFYEKLEVLAKKTHLPLRKNKNESFIKSKYSSNPKVSLNKQYVSNFDVL